MTEATAADYAWLNDHWLGEAFCITLVRGLGEAEVLRRVGGERSQPRRLTVAQVAELSEPLPARHLQLVLVATADGWSVAAEANGFEGWRPEVLRALSRGSQAVSVLDNGSEGYFSYAAEGRLLVQFELLFPQRRWGRRPDLLLAQMRAVGLDPDRDQPPAGGLATAGLALAERVTGVHLAPRVLEGPLMAAEITPLLDDPPASFVLDRQDTELAAAIGRATPDGLRQAAATAARQAVQLARLDQDPQVMEAPQPAAVFRRARDPIVIGARGGWCGAACRWRHRRPATTSSRHRAPCAARTTVPGSPARGRSPGRSGSHLACSDWMPLRGPLRTRGRPGPSWGWPPRSGARSAQGRRSPTPAAGSGPPRSSRGR